jgi:DNA-binding response OmpR family regulator
VWGIFGRFRSGKRQHTEGGLIEPAAEPLSNSTLKLLALTQTPEHWHTLQTVAAQERWMLFWADNTDLALSLIELNQIPIVVCDRDIDHEDWRIAVSRLAKTRWPVCILLATSVADDYLWRETVRQGGFDLLTKPFEPERVAKTIRFAALWRGWEKRSGH